MCKRDRRALDANPPAVSGFRKGSITAASSGAYLCRGASLHQRHHWYCHEVFYIPGPANVIAADASHVQHLTLLALASHFELSLIHTDAADEEDSVDFGGRRCLQQKKR